MDRLKVGVVFGGRSEEHPISVKSAQEVARNLDVEKYEPVYIGITRSGAWKLCDGPDAHWENGGGRPAVLSPDSSVHGVLVLEQGRYETIRLDVVLPVLHGRLGERQLPSEGERGVPRRASTLHAPRIGVALRR